MTDNREGLQIDKKVSMAFIGAVFAQTFLVGWWAATAAGELSALKEKIEAQTSNGFTRIEADIILESSKRRWAVADKRMIEDSIRLRELELTVRDLIAFERASRDE